MIEGFPNSNSFDGPDSEVLKNEEREKAHLKAMRELEQAFAKALASGYITDEDIEAAKKAARDRTEDKNIQIRAPGN